MNSVVTTLSGKFMREELRLFHVKWYDKQFFQYVFMPTIVIFSSENSAAGFSEEENEVVR